MTLYVSMTEHYACNKLRIEKVNFIAEKTYFITKCKSITVISCIFQVNLCYIWRESALHIR